jgi:hypothetical protein
MQTRTYADLFSLVEALCGVSFATIEQPRIKALINKRAKKAFRASNLWPRYLVVGEERAAVSGVIAYTEGTLRSIDTFMRIHKEAPFISRSAQEFEFMVTASGATLVSGALDPDSAWVTYKAQHDETYGDGSTDTTTVPAEWFEYIAHGTYADYLRSEGQQEKAALADAEAQEALTDELIRIDEQHTSQIVSNRIFTNANTQTR